jgi:hypothetical protein
MNQTALSNNLKTAAHPETLRRVAIEPISQLLKGQGSVPPFNLAAEIISTLAPLTFCFDLLTLEISEILHPFTSVTY